MSLESAKPANTCHVLAVLTNGHSAAVPSDACFLLGELVRDPGGVSGSSAHTRDLATPL